MVSRQRIRVPNITGTTTGGAPPTVANVQWSPASGQSDGTQFSASVSASLSALALESDSLSASASVALTATAVDFAVTPTTRSTLTGTATGPAFHVGQTTATGTTGSTLVVNKPSGVTQNDLMLAFIGVKGPVTAPTIATPSGWTASVTNTTGAIRSACFYKIAGASEPSSYTWTFTGTVSLSTGEISRIVGPDTTTPIGATASATVTPAALDPDPNVPSVTTTGSDRLVYAHLLHDHAALTQSHTPPANHVETTDFQASAVGDFLGQTTSWRVFAAAGATGGVEVDCTETVGTSGVMFRVAVRPGTVTLA